MSPRLLQINTVINSGSTGHIAEDINKFCKEKGWECYTIYGRKRTKSCSVQIKIGNRIDFLFHVVMARIFDNQGLLSFQNTLKIVRFIKKVNPDIIQLHNLHGYYLNYKYLFIYLKKINIPIIWTLHDCWSYTGHCAYYSFYNCNKWQENCSKCAYKKTYPKSILLSMSKRNFLIKKKSFTGVNNLTLVTPSEWLRHEVSKSFLREYDCKVIYNGVDRTVFFPHKVELQKKYIILGVANIWEERKGLSDFITLSTMLNDDEQIVLVGVSKEQCQKLPGNILCIPRTENQEQLAQLYSEALVLVSTSVEETLGMTTLEAQACGTPVIAYNVTAIPETFRDDTGYKVAVHDISSIRRIISEIEVQGKRHYSNSCVDFVSDTFDSDAQIHKYYDLYMKKINEKGK